MSQTQDLFVWSTRFETGLAEVDAQHRRLVQMINRLARLSDRTGSAELTELIDALQDYTRYHFKTEETLMREYGVDPEFAAAHTRAHSSLIEQTQIMREMALQADDAGARAVATLLPFLAKWLVFHILGTDMRMAHEIRALQTGAAPDAAHREAALKQSESLMVLLDSLNELTDNFALRTAQLTETNRRVRISETRYALAQRASHIGSWELDLASGAFLWLEGIDALLCCPAGPEPCLDQFIAHVPVEDRSLITAALAGMRAQGDSFTLEHRFVRPDGSLRWLEARCQLMHAPEMSKPTLLGILRDITEERAAKELLRETNRQLLLSLSSLEHHVADLTLLNELNESLQSCISVSEAYEVAEHCLARLRLGVGGALSVPAPGSDSDLVRVCAWGRRSKVSAIFPADGCWAMRRGLRHMVERGADRPKCHHFDNEPDDGYLCLPLQVLGDALGLLTIEFPADAPEVERTRINHLASMVAESLKLALANIRLREALHERATRDPLTGLLNRRYLDESLPRELHRAQREKQTLTIAMLDLDNFKLFNDTWGHAAGDAVLEEVAASIRRQLRASDLACRFGGEEIVIVMLGAEIDEALARIAQIAQNVSESQVRLEGVILPPITFSAGIAQAFVHGTTAAELLRAADRALYVAKESGRNCTVVAQPPA